MAEKLKPLNMSFDEALTRLARVPRSAGTKPTVEKKVKLANNKKGASASRPPVVKKSG